MTDAVVPYTGWGRGGWSSLEFGAGSLSPTPSLVASPGTVTLFVEENVSINLVGLQGAANFGGIMVEPDMNVFPGGVFASGSSGQVSNVTGDANTLAQGQLATTGSPSASLEIEVEFGVVGLQLVSQISGVMVEPDMNVFPVGVTALSGVSPVDVSGDAALALVGVSATAPHSDVSINISAPVSVAGVDAFLSTAGVLVWDSITPSQLSGFVKIVPDQTSSFSKIDPIQSADFVGVTPSQQPDWAEITPETA
jgi:hypothetical protein